MTPAAVREDPGGPARSGRVGPLLAFRQHKPESGDDVAYAELEVFRWRVAGNVRRRHADGSGDPASTLDQQEALGINGQGEKGMPRKGWRETSIRQRCEQFIGPCPGGNFSIILTADAAHDEIALKRVGREEGVEVNEELAEHVLPFLAVQRRHALVK